MTILEAHAMLAGRSDRTTHEYLLAVAETDLWPACATAAVKVSGMLESCRNDADLDEALAHAGLLVGSGVVSTDQLTEAGAEVVDEVMAWGGSYAMN